MSLKINRQSDLDELFTKFAIDPVDPPKKKEKENDVKKEESKTDSSK
ncbi:SPJ_0845 family protein [Ligilactobacillus equi]|nr:SPJ_0845 family protein [Ligilactobacillus equi]MCQ2556964.1 hypothetical protein [Ligilactobacillus sp.]